ncbi:hypothetical protein CBS101457_002941 [Exobasidium rhododendri]|nr:hypothetical protein CBS101457_002941 [Exobasidium rhododendri]
MSPPLTRIDVHHHYFPDITKLASANGWTFPKDAHPWSPEVSIDAMNKLGIQKAILSSPNAAENAREVNIFASGLAAKHPDRFGFFAALAIDTQSMDAVLDEVRHSLDELHADGISLVSSYSNGKESKYLGHAYFEPLWRELNEREAIVFLHGDQVPSTNSVPSDRLPIPIVEVPNETYKAAADLVTSGMKRRYPKVKIILSHSGGSTPFLACRAAVLGNYIGNTVVGNSLSIDEMLEDFKSFYYETALSGYKTNLVALQSFVEKDHILFGTDFPAVGVDTAAWFTKQVDQHYQGNEEEHSLIMKGNFEKLLKKK